MTLLAQGEMAMSMWWPVALALASLLLVALLWRKLRAFSRDVQGERAREMFKLQRERLEAEFLRAAAASGKPRGLRWCECQWEESIEFVRERRTGQIAAIVGVTVRFEAVQGSDMEGVPAVNDLKNASAVFFFHRGQWHTVGKALFNKNPDEAVQHFEGQYERLGPGP
jgi:hypothetical protein